MRLARPAGQLLGALIARILTPVVERSRANAVQSFANPEPLALVPVRAWAPARLI